MCKERQVWRWMEWWAGGWMVGRMDWWVGGRASEQRDIMLLGAGEPLDDHTAQLLRLAPQRSRRECRQPPRVEGELARALPRRDVGDVGLRARGQG